MPNPGPIAAGAALPAALASALLAACLAAALPAPRAAAQAVISTGQSFVTADLLAGAPGQGGGARVAGLSLSMADGWKTYWRSPGEAGLPPVFDWSGSTNLRSAEVLWPRPELFESFGLTTVGYADAVLLPVRLVAEDPALPIGLRLTASLGVCRELCVLEEVDLSETIGPAEAEAAAQVARALDAVPGDAAESGLLAARCRVTGAGAERRLEAELEFTRPFAAPVVLVEGPASVWIGSVTSTAEGGALSVSAEVEMLDAAAWIDRRDLRLTVLDGAFAADITGCAAPGG